MARYTGVKSEYIKRLLGRTPWSRRKRIDDLITLRGFLVDGPRSFAEAMHYHQLKSKYWWDYLELLAESFPERLEAALALADHQEAERERLMAAMRQREEEEYRDWLAAGGRG